MSVSAEYNRFTGSGYDSGIWQARHAIAKGVIIIFSIIFLGFKGVWGAIAGCLGSIARGWRDDVSPLFSKR